MTMTSVMSLRTSWRHLGRLSRSGSTLQIIPHHQFRFASSATAASNLPEHVKAAIEHEASVPNADPSTASLTESLLNNGKDFMVRTYARPSLVFQKGEGCYLWDLENRRYLDFTAGIAVNSLGHSDPALARVISSQSSTLLHTSNLYHHPWIGALSRLLIESTLASGGMSGAAKAFISNSGSEANEAAIKFARKYGHTRDSSGRKFHMVSFKGSFHGRTMGSLSATPNPKYQAPFAPLLPGFSYLPFNCSTAELEAAITPETCGVLLEPIQGEGGVNVATSAFLHALRKRCNEVDALLIYDEIQSGLSRAGNHSLWAHDAILKSDAPSSSQPPAHPDVLTTAKALGNGIPIGATLITDTVADAIKVGDHGTTFGGNALACRVAHHVFTRLSSPEMQAAVAHKSSLFRASFEKLQKRWPDRITEVRGSGLILGVQLSCDPGPIVEKARERGLLVITCGSNTLRFVPPLVVSEAEIEEGMGILEQAMEAAWTQ